MPPEEDTGHQPGDEASPIVIYDFGAKDREVFDKFVSYHPELRLAICNNCGFAISRETSTKLDGGLCARRGCLNVISPGEIQTIIDMLGNLALVSNLDDFQFPSYLGDPLRELTIFGGHIMCTEPCVPGEHDHPRRILNRGNVCGKMFNNDYDLRGHWIRHHPQLLKLSNGHFESDVYWQQLPFFYIDDDCEEACRHVRFQVKVTDGITSKRESTKRVVAIRTMIKKPVRYEEPAQMSPHKDTIDNENHGSEGDADSRKNNSARKVVPRYIESASDDDSMSDAASSSTDEDEDGHPTQPQSSNTQPRSIVPQANAHQSRPVCAASSSEAQVDPDMPALVSGRDLSPASSRTIGIISSLAESSDLSAHQDKFNKGKQPALSEPTIASADKEAGPAAFQRYLSFVESIPQRRRDLAFASDWVQTTIDAVDGLTSVLRDRDLPSKADADTNALKRAVRHMDNLGRSLAEFEEIPVKRVKRG